jgi:hypothetical protein
MLLTRAARQRPLSLSLSQPVVSIVNSFAQNVLGVGQRQQRRLRRLASAFTEAQVRRCWRPAHVARSLTNPQVREFGFNTTVLVQGVESTPRELEVKFLSSTTAGCS